MMSDEKTMSMGCLVKESFCSICGGIVPECDHTRPPTEEEARKLKAPWHESLRKDLLGFHDVSSVGPSECEACKTPMKPVDSIHWACVNQDCDQKGIPVHTGVYPFLPIEDT